ncbi:MAG: hypothetical protein KIT31_32505 [Deltaproteobacteria bacterium]|nr:hypothetical protein [Deltaproteobacteria bacterium]
MSRAPVLAAVVAVVVTSGACTPTAKFVPPPAKEKRPDPSPLWVGWRLADPKHPLVRVCERSAMAGGLAACWRGGIAGIVKGTDGGFVGDTNIHDAIPGGKCKFEYREGTNALPAELTIAERVIDRFSADGADARVQTTSIRASFSPDGAWLAVIYVVKRARGEASSSLDIDHVALVPVGDDPCALVVQR